MAMSARFLKTIEQTERQAYWGRMRCVGEIGQGCSAFRVQFHPHTPHGSHRHPDHDELIYVIAGSIRQIIDDETQVLNAGESAIIPRGTWHFAQPLVDGTEVLVVVDGAHHGYVAEEAEPTA